MCGSDHFLSPQDYRCSEEMKPDKKSPYALRNYLYKTLISLNLQNDAALLDILEKMLKFNPEERISCHDALNHHLFRSEPF